MDEDTCMVEVARFFMNFTQNESCGKCVPCREGTRRMLDILEKIVAGNGELSDLDILERLADTITATALCGLGKTAANPVQSTLKYFRDEYIEHIVDKKCRTRQLPGPQNHLHRQRSLQGLLPVLQGMSCRRHLRKDKGAV